MSYEFTKLSEVPAVSEFPEGANAIIETNGEIKRCPPSGDGGASSSDVLIIHATPDETYTHAQLDKTAEQIYEAYQSGKYCLVYAAGVFFHTTTVETDGARYMMQCYGFKFLSDGQGQVVMLEFTTNDGVTWTTRPMSPVLQNVRTQGLQISGYGNRMYTISVDADGNLIATLAT